MAGRQALSGARNLNRANKQKRDGYLCAGSHLLQAPVWQVPVGAAIRCEKAGAIWKVAPLVSQSCDWDDLPNDAGQPYAKTSSR